MESLKQFVSDVRLLLARFARIKCRENRVGFIPHFGGCLASGDHGDDLGFVVDRDFGVEVGDGVEGFESGFCE